MDSEEEARKTVHRLWPNEALPGELAQILPTPARTASGLRAGHARPLSPPMGPDLEPCGECGSTDAESTSCSAGHQWTFSETLADMAPEQWGGETVD